MIDVPISDLISKDLRRWFKEKWVDVSRKDKDGNHPPCGRSDAKLDSKGYPKCRPSKKVSEDTPTTTRGISAEEKKKMTRRKRSKPQGVGGKPTIVKSGLPLVREIPELPDDGMFTASANPFETAWDSITKGKFRGYTQSNISDRPYRQAEHRVWDVSRRNKKAKTRRRYARQLSRGNFRPEMRRQLGAGGKRASTKR